jgi:hypothetical protein
MVESIFHGIKTTQLLLLHLALEFLSSFRIDVMSDRHSINWATVPNDIINWNYFPAVDTQYIVQEK